MTDAEIPKTIVGRTNTPSLTPVPSTSLAWLAEAHADGARKYGPLNWRETPIPLTIYIDAMVRHLLALREGQDCAPDSGLPHLAHVMAGASIVLDAEACGTLIDDRENGRIDAYEFTLTEIARIRRARCERDA
ncbi:dATP/dGTP diphosphohydrolase domain-containing protein [Aureimonas ureilytica]|uniref:dATP/dGTP diphosphohydrolase domain-containing protein n=1 Tax=Aureimonas ureilytica TaxID=401562 RepID=UPI000734D5A1|nr:dATP/dGTP diphosphohydrolase domain-containing protein [Aureimonas ureilytica]